MYIINNYYNDSEAKLFITSTARKLWKPIIDEQRGMRTRQISPGNNVGEVLCLPVPVAQIPFEVDSQPHPAQTPQYQQGQCLKDDYRWCRLIELEWPQSSVQGNSIWTSYHSWRSRPHSISNIPESQSWVCAAAGLWADHQPTGQSSWRECLHDHITLWHCTTSSQSPKCLMQYNLMHMNNCFLSSLPLEMESFLVPYSDLVTQPFSILCGCT